MRRRIHGETLPPICESKAFSYCLPVDDRADHVSRLFNYGYNDTSLENIVNTFAKNARAEFNAKSGFDEEQIYVSYGHGDEPPEVLYSTEKLPRLRELKKKWDPTSQFSFNEPF